MTTPFFYETDRSGELKRLRCLLDGIFLKQNDVIAGETLCEGDVGDASHVGICEPLF